MKRSQVLFSRKMDIIGLYDALKVDFIKENSLVALKIHFGEIGNTAYIKPDKIKPLIEKILSLKALPFLTDANTLYKGTRGDAVNHLTTAHKHGYDISNLNVPVIIADGLTGKDYVKVDVNLKHFKDVKIGAAAYHAESIVVLTHFKGHELMGFGGSLKNIGMGLGARSGKQMMHANIKPEVNKDKCTGCGDCVKWCPTNAIELVNRKAVIDLKKCIGCGECVATCNFSAIAIDWGGEPDKAQERMVEYFYGVWKDKKEKMIYFNYLTDISPQCDCYGFTDPPIAPNIGLLASYDPVAIDQASVDLVNSASGSKDKFREVHPDIDWSTQLSYAGTLGIGRREYELTQL